MQLHSLQRSKSSVGTPVGIGVMLGIATYTLIRQIPTGDLAALFNHDAVLAALNTGQTHMLTLTAAAFGVGLGGNYFVSSLGNLLNRQWVGKVTAGLIALIVISGLAGGVAAGWLSGITVPIVMNPGVGLFVGSGLGWWTANELPRQPLTAWSAGVITALMVAFGLLVLE